MKKKKRVLIVGTGTIGAPLGAFLARHKRVLGIDEVLFHKHKANIEDAARISQLIKTGAKLCVDEKSWRGFRKIGLKHSYTTNQALEIASVVIDCTEAEIAFSNKASLYKQHEDHLLGIIAQGSAEGFGAPYIYGVSDELLDVNKKYIQVLSCNTHNIVVTLQTLGFDDNRVPIFEYADFVCLRRDSDISQSPNEAISSPVVENHKDPLCGTHHAKDAQRIFKEILGYELPIFSSAIKLNSQYMHSVRFRIKLHQEITIKDVLKKIKANKHIALTYRNNTGQVFAFGREHGHYGRILNNTVFVLKTLEVVDGNTIIGWSFTPQDGNSLISSIAATLFYLYPYNYKKIMMRLNKYLFRDV